MSYPSLTSKQRANSLICACIQSHIGIWQDNVDAESYMINMEAPLPADELKEKAKWASNFNFGRGLNIIKRIVKENTSEVNRAISMMDIVMEDFDKKKHKEKIYAFLAFPELKKEFEERLAYVFADFIESKQSFSTFISRAEYMNFMFGYAAAVKGDEGYLPDIVHFKDIGFEDHTNINDIQRFVVFEKMKGDYFFSKLMDFKDYFTDKDIRDALIANNCTCLHYEDSSFVNEEGWNPDAVLEIVCSCFSSNAEAVEFLTKEKNWAPTEDCKSLTFNTWEDISLLSQNKGGDWCRVNMNNIYTARCYEVGNKSLYESRVFIGNAAGSLYQSEYQTVRNIFYYKRHPDLSQNEAITMIYDFSLDGSNFIHDVKGACYQLAQHSLRFDIEQNNLKDSLYMTNLIWMTNIGNGNLNRALDINIAGGLATVGANIEFVQVKNKIDLSDNILAVQQEKQEFNESFSRHQPNLSLSNRPTKDEVQFVNAEAYSQRNSDIPFKLKAYSKILTNAFKVLVGEDFISENFEVEREEFINNYISEFRELNLDEKDIKKILNCIKKIDVTPVLSDREAIGQAMSFAATGAARRRLTKMYLLSFGFRINQIRSYIDYEEYGVDSSIVSIENDMFERTQEVTFGLNQDHILHLNGHFYKMDRRLQGVKAGEDPVVAFNMLRNGLINCRQHIDTLAILPFYKKQVKEFEAYYKMFEKELKSLADGLDEARKNAQQNNQQGGQMQISPELRQKLYEQNVKLQEKLRTSAMRTQQAQEQRIQQQKFTQQLKMEDAKFKQQLETMKAQTDVDLKLMEQSAKMAG